ncbi:hypothetical protein FHG87_006752 [Trinorchestia longiramus]|nr:hypothetical protein FHG87_006752 [Trinorchestia longiramus]
MEPNQNRKKTLRAEIKYCKECKATCSLQFCHKKGCNMEESCFCYSNHESSALIKNYSREIQELSRQLELLMGRLETIEKQNHKHELRLQSSETHCG